MLAFLYLNVEQMLLVKTRRHQFLQDMCLSISLYANDYTDCKYMRPLAHELDAADLICMQQADPPTQGVMQSLQVASHLLLLNSSCKTTRTQIP